jgi:hypothetical protein
MTAWWSVEPSSRGQVDLHPVLAGAGKGPADGSGARRKGLATVRKGAEPGAGQE